LLPPSSGGGPGAGGAGGAGAQPACQSIVQRPEIIPGGQADIIIAVDTSGSMDDETLAVQNNLNRLSASLTAANIDAHVVLIAFRATSSRDDDENSICIAPPLGVDGACPYGDDSRAPNFLHVAEEVGSHDALEVITSTLPRYQSMLRPGATKTILVVTDDEAEPADPQAFSTWVGSQSAFQGSTFRFSGIFCTGSSDNCENAGTTYSTLLTQTGGVFGDLGQFATGQVDQQFQVVFDSLTKAVVRDAVPVDCEWKIPPIPAGKVLDPKKVNVRFTSGAGVQDVLFALGSAAECAAAGGGWYYDVPSAPTRVIACESSCTKVRADDQGMIEVLFECTEQKRPVM
jgi:hypothetical protein